MDELILCTSNAIYLPINTDKTINYSPELVALCTSMITPDPKQRATMSDVISNNLIVRRYYRSYFDYGYRTTRSADVQNNNK